HRQVTEAGAAASAWRRPSRWLSCIGRSAIPGLGGTAAPGTPADRRRFGWTGERTDTTVGGRASRTHPIQEDMEFQRRSWLVQRTSWIIMALVLVAALAGLFFHGPLSHTTARNADGSVAVEYERFAHKTTVTHFIIRISPPVPA